MAAGAVTQDTSATTVRTARRVPFGAALEYDHFISDPDYTALFVSHCDMIFPMNALKWDALQACPGEFDFSRADDILSFAETLGRGTYGHTFVWYNALPQWVEEIDRPAQAEAALIDHVRTVASRFSGRVPVWDVVNEVIAHDPAHEGPWRDSLWMRLLGPAHVDIAFSAAAEAAPGAELAVNDYDLEFTGPRYDARREAVLDLVRRLQDRQLRIDAIGIQGHLYPEIPIDHQGLGRFIRDLEALGVGYRLTEIDVIDWNLPPDAALRDEMAAEHVGNLLDAAFSAALPRSVSTWGLSDRYSWISDVMPHRAGAPNRPLPFDEALKPKPMYEVIQRYLSA
ncbi:endo-1,4-beta-xylanase [Nitratireductor sp. XY-223]|uniref:endo-1,4-beta-xylanase n=1 Tax=Nitratireductor sp. XY-223 TaxID=2561926 RepID=UPI001FED4EE9|nr:endo-1,4-beta-xylanase [Nitratireductor sp. XY-223]